MSTDLWVALGTSHRHARAAGDPSRRLRIRRPRQLDRRSSQLRPRHCSRRERQAGLTPARSCFARRMRISALATHTGSRVRRWLSVRHRLRSEAAVVLGLYGFYELARGVVVGDTGDAVQHAHRVVALERWLHLLLEADVQHAARALPGLTRVLGAAYLTLHLAVTAGVLLWLHQRRPAAFAFVRTTLLFASAFALVGFLAYPTAPPRLAGIGIADTVSNGHIDLNKGLVSSLYNPYAAVPSMHVGYALIVGASLLLYGRAPNRSDGGSALRAVRAVRRRRHRQPLLLRRRHRCTRCRRSRRDGSVTHTTRRSRPNRRAANSSGVQPRVRGTRGMTTSDAAPVVP